jgi:L-asparaginase
MAKRTRTAVNDGADGVVITHGTDTMEKSAYYLDLVLDLDAPVVFTGAQRRSDEVSPDGLSNLLTAVRAASHGRFRGAGGVYIAFDVELHAARDVTKEHTSNLSAFVSPDKCPVVRLTRESVRVHREPEAGRHQLESPQHRPTLPW